MYRSSSPPPVEILEAEPDPFPSIACLDCGRPTTSMAGEDLCASCDLKWLNRGVDWATVIGPFRAATLGTKEIACGTCRQSRPWPSCFPVRIEAKCGLCFASEAFRMGETGAFVLEAFRCRPRSRPSSPEPGSGRRSPR